MKIKINILNYFLKVTIVYWLVFGGFSFISKSSEQLDSKLNYLLFGYFIFNIILLIGFLFCYSYLEYSNYILSFKKFGKLIDCSIEELYKISRIKGGYGFFFNNKSFYFIVNTSKEEKQINELIEMIKRDKQSCKNIKLDTKGL